jgi:hypothetical protein
MVFGEFTRITISGTKRGALIPKLSRRSFESWTIRSLASPLISTIYVFLQVDSYHLVGPAEPHAAVTIKHIIVQVARLPKMYNNDGRQLFHVQLDERSSSQSSKPFCTFLLRSWPFGRPRVILDFFDSVLVVCFDIESSVYRNVAQAS